MGSTKAPCSKPRAGAGPGLGDAGGRQLPGGSFPRERGLEEPPRMLLAAGRGWVDEGGG